MKYEPVFGDQSLFDGASKLTVAIRAVPYSAKNIEVTMTQLIGLDVVNYQQYPVIAMRRIIAEPKRWTVEDQKAGRLPEVDCVVRATGMNKDARIAAINNDSVCVVFEYGAFVTLHVSGIAPIEAPEERAKREEDEFIDLMVKELNVNIYSVSYQIIRSAIRHSYRKMKGGA